MQRPLLVVIAVAFTIAAAAGVLALSLRPQTSAVASPSPSPTLSPTPTPSPTAVATASPAASPSVSAPPAASPSATATAAPNYANVAWGYTLALPPPYRHSDALSFKSPPPDAGEPKGSDAFTARTLQDEAAVNKNCETACEIWNYVAEVEVWTNAGTMTARQWADDPNRAGWSASQRVEDFTLNGRPAARTINGTRGPLTYVVASGGRMYVLSYKVYPFPDFSVPTGATRDKLEAIMNSFVIVP